MRKPKILHLLDDRRVGGISRTLGPKISSQLRDKFDFIAAPTQMSEPALRRLKPDITILHDPCTWRNLPLLCRITPCTKLIVHDHHYSRSFEQYNVPSKMRFRLMLRLAYGTANRVVAVSHAQGEWMREHRLVEPHKLSVIRQSPPIAEFLDIPAKQRALPVILAAYGRFSQQKGFDILLRAMQLVPSHEVQLLLGGYGSDEAMLRQLAQGTENIRFVGKIDDVPAFLATCDVVLIPSRWEPWGNVCLEAKAAGKPVIVCGVDGLVEQVEECGLVVPPEDPQALAQAIAQICDLPAETLTRWGQNGRRAVRSSGDKYLEEWEALLWEVLSKPN